MPTNRHELAMHGDAETIASIFITRKEDFYRLALLTPAQDEVGGVNLGYAAALTREQVSALAGMLSAVLDDSDAHAVAVHHL